MRAVLGMPCSRSTVAGLAVAGHRARYRCLLGAEPRARLHSYAAAIIRGTRLDAARVLADAEWAIAAGVPELDATLAAIEQLIGECDTCLSGCRCASCAQAHEQKAKHHEHAGGTSAVG